MIRVLVADDHSAIRNGVRLILSTEFSEIEFGEAINGAEVLKKIQDEKWDVIILQFSKLYTFLL